jgi:hypothetical protein
MVPMLPWTTWSDHACHAMHVASGKMTEAHLGKSIIDAARS